jgi:hypothetical protein
MYLFSPGTLKKENALPDFPFIPSQIIAGDTLLPTDRLLYRLI